MRTMNASIAIVRRGGPRTGAGGSYAGAVERRRASSRTAAQIRPRAASGSITLSVMRSMVAAADELRGYLAAGGGGDSLTATELTRPGSELADLVRRYQAASRQFLRDWLQRPRQTSWLVDSASGRILDAITEDERAGTALGAAAQLTVAEDQQLHGLRRRFERPGVGIPVVIWTRRSGPDQGVDLAGHTAAQARTAVVGVEMDADRRVRSVAVRLVPAAETATIAIGGCELPLAADFTAPVAQTIGLERRPPASAYGTRDPARRGTVDGFVALTPPGRNLAPLILLEGAGLSPLMMAQLANEVAGDPELRRRFQVWLYRFPMVAPLFFAASLFRTDLERFYARLEAVTGSTAPGGTVVAHGAGAVLAKSLLVGSGSAVWGGAFATPLERLNVGPQDRALLERMFFWSPSARVDRIIAVAEPRNVEALTAGVGARSIQLLLRQPPELRGAIERIYGSQKKHLRSPPHDVDAGSGVDGPDAFYQEPICAALAGAALAADRKLLALLSGGAGERDAVLFERATGLLPVDADVARAPCEPLGPQSLPRVLDWLRPRH
jgi:hypothetical protein